MNFVETNCDDFGARFVAEAPEVPGYVARTVTAVHSAFLGGLGWRREPTGRNLEVDEPKQDFLERHRF